MRIGFVFHHDPLHRSPGIDVVRLTALTSALIEFGLDVYILAPVQKPGLLGGRVPVLPVHTTNLDQYALLKTCYHQSIRLVKGFSGPVVSRIVRVVDQTWPQRDKQARKELLACQHSISQRAQAVALNNQINQHRWTKAYPAPGLTVLTPTGCPAHLPAPGPSPYAGHKPVFLFLGSLAAPRMLRLLNALAEDCRSVAEIHLVGRNKTALYGQELDLSPLIVDHGEHSEPGLWNYLYHADLGLALAAGPHAFNNDLSKIYAYLRTGLPVVVEARVIQSTLVRDLQFGRVFAYGSLPSLTKECLELIRSPPAHASKVMDHMATKHSWETRAGTYANLFQALLGREPGSQGTKS